MATTKFRKINPDPVYQSVELSKFINALMNDGQKETARKVVYQALDIVKEKTKHDPMVVFQDAIRQIAPLLEVKSKRVGGATYQVPHEVKGKRQQTLAFRWLFSSPFAASASSYVWLTAIATGSSSIKINRGRSANE